MQLCASRGFKGPVAAGSARLGVFSAGTRRIAPMTVTRSYVVEREIVREEVAAMVTKERMSSEMVYLEKPGLDTLLEEVGEETHIQEMKEEPKGALQRLAKYLSDVFNVSDRTRGLILLNVMTFIMATNCVVVKDAESVMDPFTFSALRFSIAVIALVPFLEAGNKIDKEVLRAGCELGCWSTLGYVMQSVGLLTTEASRAAFLGAFTVILVPFLAGLSGKGISRSTWFAAFVALLGTTLLEQGGSSPPGIGDVFNLMSAAFFALQVIRTERFTREMPDKATALLTTTLGTTAVLSGALAIGMHPGQCLELVQNFSSSSIPWKELVYTGILSTDLVLFIELVALNNVSSTDAAIVYTMEPVIGAVFAYFMLGERWGPMGWVGGVLILMSSLGTQLLNDDGQLEAAEEQH